MKEWIKSKSNVKPLEVQEVVNNRFLLHRNITEIVISHEPIIEIDSNGHEKETAVPDTMEYEYDELLVTASEYELMQELKSRDIQIEELQEALIELAGMVGDSNG